jgi:hypothetical protein
MFTRIVDVFERRREIATNMNNHSIFLKTYLGLIATFLLLTPTHAQIDTPATPPDRDLSDLYKRASASRFVVIGTVVKIGGVSKRMTAELLERVKAEGELSLTLGGSLYTIRIENTVCEQQDFAKSGNHSVESPLIVYVFLPRDEPAVVGGHMRETFSLGHRYLLFLAEPSHITLEKWNETYELQPNRIYYRGEGLSRGVVPLDMPTVAHSSSEDKPILEKVTALCSAMRAATVEKKLAALKDLSSSGDPILQREADIATEALKARGRP